MHHKNTGETGMRLLIWNQLTTPPMPSFEGSLENLKAIESKEIRVRLNRPPAFVGMMIQHREAHLLDRAFVRGRRTGVIDDPVALAFAVHMRFAD